MGDPRDTDAEHNMLIDVVVTGEFKTRTETQRCRATPKRIYTMGGSVFERATGKWVARLDDRVRATYRYRAKPETLRPAQEKATS